MATTPPSTRGGAEPAAVAELSYSEAGSELDGIIEEFETGVVDVDRLVEQLERATDIVDELDRRLRRTRMRVEELVPRLEAIGQAEVVSEVTDDGAVVVDIPTSGGDHQVDDQTPGLF